MLDKIFDREMPYYFRPIEKTMVTGIAITSIVLMILALKGNVSGVVAGWTLMGLSTGSLIVGNMRFARSDKLENKKEKYTFAIEIINSCGMIMIGVMGGMGMISGLGTGVTLLSVMGVRSFFSCAYPFIEAKMNGKSFKSIFDDITPNFQLFLKAIDVMKEKDLGDLRPSL